MVEEAISLIHRLVENLPEQVSYWDGPRDQIDDLENFAGFNDSEIEKIRNLLQSTERVPVEPYTEAFSQGMVGMLEEEEDSDYIPLNFTKNGTFAVDSTLRSKATRDFRFDLMDSRVTGIFQTEIQTEQFEKIEFYQDQVFYIVTKCKIESSLLSWKEIGNIFGVSRSAIRTIYDRIAAGKKSPGRPRSITKEIEAQMIRYITDSYAKKDIIHYEDVHNWLEVHHHISVLPNTLIKIINSIDSLKVVQGKPMEKERVDFDEASIQEYFEKLTRDITDAPASLVINIDECGYQEWADAHIENVIVPKEHRADTIELPKNRSQRRSTMVASITADGGTLKPMLIVSRKTIETEIYETGYTPNECIFVFQENGFIDSDLFLRWATDVLVPYVIKERERLLYSGPAYLIMDGCSTHLSDEFCDLCLEYGVEIELLPAHTSDQLQPLDLGIFAIQKQAMGRIHPPPWVNPLTAQLQKILGSFRAVTVRPNVVAAFQQGGIISRWDPEHESLLAQVNVSLVRKARCVLQASLHHQDRITLE